MRFLVIVKEKCSKLVSRKNRVLSLLICHILLYKISYLLIKAIYLCNVRQI